MYNGHKKNGRNRDFIALSLVGGVPEFRINFNVSTIRLTANKPITFGKWHTVKVVRHRKKGNSIVDFCVYYLQECIYLYLQLECMLIEKAHTVLSVKMHMRV